MDQIGLGKVDGDPIEALEEALDWEGRKQFVDRYLDIPFDLTDTLFIATAQDFYRVPGDLRDLLVEIRIAGYTPEEKVDIALERMLPRLIREHGLEPGDVACDRDTLFFLARGSARDPVHGFLHRSPGPLLPPRA